MGIRKDILLIEMEENRFEEFEIRDVGTSLFFYLRALADLTEEQSKQLIQEGLSIGRPYGYTFTGFGFVYLLSLRVDLFGLINSGFAKNIKHLMKEIIDSVQPETKIM